MGAIPIGIAKPWNVTERLGMENVPFMDNVDAAVRLIRTLESSARYAHKEAD
jgi:hypothetical protein